MGVIQFSTEPRVEVPLTPLGNDGATQLSAALDNMVRASLGLHGGGACGVELSSKSW